MRRMATARGSASVASTTQRCRYAEERVAARGAFARNTPFRASEKRARRVIDVQRASFAPHAAGVARSMKPVVCSYNVDMK